MTFDDLFKGVVGLAFTGTAAISSWLLRTVLKDHQTVMLLEAKVANLEKDQITTDCVREVVEEALDKRDKIAELRRVEWDRRHSLEIKQAVSEELEKLTPKIIREVRNATSRIPPEPKE